MQKEKSVNVINRGVNDERRGFVVGSQTCHHPARPVSIQQDLSVSAGPDSVAAIRIADNVAAARIADGVADEIAEELHPTKILGINFVFLCRLKNLQI